MDYEKMLICCDNSNIDVMELPLKGHQGLILNTTIAIKKDLSTTEKACTLAEEIGHLLTSSGNILDQKDIRNIKQERTARIWAHDAQIGLDGIVRCFEARCRTIYEMAEYLDVTEEFLYEAIAHYKEKYGICVEYKCYSIYFEPTLMVHKKSRGEFI